MKPMKINRKKIRKQQQWGQLTDLFYLALAEQASESFIIHDFQGRIRDVNQFACETLGYTREELLQMTIPDIEMDFDLISAQREWVKIEPNVHFTLNGHQRRKNGTVFPVEVRFGCVDWKGERLYLGLIRDVTDRVEIKNKLLKTQALLNETQRLAQIGGWEYNVHTKQIRWTAEIYRIFGMPQSSDLKVTNIFSYYHPEDQPLIKKAFQRLLDTGEPYDLDLRLDNKNGERIWIKSIGQAEYLEGDIVRAHGYVMDISDQKITEELLINEKDRAQEANRIKEQFLANMSHELRTPLNGLMGMTQLLKMSALTEEQEEFVDLSIQACTAITDVVNEILNYTVMQKKQMKCIEVPFKMKELISEVMELHRIMAVKKQLEIDFTISPQVPEIIMGDRYKLKQLLNNLVGNAVKFTEAGAVHIIVNTESSDHRERIRLSFEVIDTGIGIQDQLIDHIFGRFNQVDGSHTREYGGLGLGLSIVNELSKVMDGEVKVSSVPGQGSNFCFVCEMGIEMMEEKVVTVEKELLPTEDQSQHILVVDDDEASRKVTAIYLSKIGMIVDEANNGFEAIEKVKKRDYELILMDLQMPGMDGYDATKMIREITSPELKKVPILAMTALAMPSVQEKCMEVGMNDYLVKPLSLNLWKDKIAYWIDHDQGNEGVMTDGAT